MKCGVGMIVLAALGLLVGSCHKEMESGVRFPRLPPPRKPVPLVPHPFVLRPLLLPEVCIGSYDDLVQQLGSSTVVIAAVELENGITIPVGAGILSMEYVAVQQPDSYSLFRSRFTVHFNYYGYVQSHLSDVWSLGCVYEPSAIPPFTNLKRSGQVITINTKLYWGTGEQAGQLIRYLFVQ